MSLSRRSSVLVAATAASLALAGAAVPSDAAKKKPAPIKGSYTVTLLPDPTPNVSAQTGSSGCNDATADTHAFTAPAAGTLSVILDGNDPAKGGLPAGVDWDLYVHDAQGEVGSSHGGTAHEEVSLKLKKKTALSFIVCNLGGPPDGAVTYLFTFA